MRNYRGVVQDESVQGTLFNHSMLSVFVNKAVRSAEGLAPDEFIEKVGRMVKDKFGSHIEIEYYDRTAAESIGFMDEHTEFCLRLTSSSVFHSQGVH